MDRKMNNLELSRDRFFDFDHGHVREAGKVEIYRFLENLSHHQKPQIFINFHRQVFEKLINFHFTGFSYVTMVEIEKSVPTKL